MGKQGHQVVLSTQSFVNKKTLPMIPEPLIDLLKQGYLNKAQDILI